MNANTPHSKDSLTVQELMATVDQPGILAGKNSDQIHEMLTLAGFTNNEALSDTEINDSALVQVGSSIVEVGMNQTNYRVRQIIENSAQPTVAELEALQARIPKK